MRRPRISASAPRLFRQRVKIFSLLKCVADPMGNAPRGSDGVPPPRPLKTRRSSRREGVPDAQSHESTSTPLRGSPDKKPPRKLSRRHGMKKSLPEETQRSVAPGTILLPLLPSGPDGIRGVPPHGAESPLKDFIIILTKIRPFARRQCVPAAPLPPKGGSVPAERR